MKARAAEIGLDLPESCMPGVAANLDLLARHMAVLRGFDACDGAAVPVEQS